MAFAATALAVMLFGLPLALWLAGMALHRLQFGSESTGDVLVEIGFTLLTFSVGVVLNSVLMGWTRGDLPIDPILMGMVILSVLYASVIAWEMLPSRKHALPCWLGIAIIPFVSALLQQYVSFRTVANLTMLATLAATAAYAHWAYTVELRADVDPLQEVTV